MGIKTTYNISRQTAIDVVKSKIDNAANEELEEILLGFKESYFKNYSVYDELPNDGWDYVISDVDDFN
jgi:hypothetical protein